MNALDPMADMSGDVVEGHTRMDQLAARRGGARDCWPGRSGAGWPGGDG